MLTQQTLDQLRGMKLRAMADTYEQQLAQPALASMPFDDRLGVIVEAEVSARETRKLKRLVAMAKLPEFPLLEDVDYRPARNLDQALIKRLATGEWVQRMQNVLLIGACGTGKTWIGDALAGQMCRLGYTVYYRSCAELFDDFTRAHGDGSWPKLRRRLVQVKVLMIDDLGLAPVTADIGHMLLDVIDKRTRSGSLIITSQYPISKWHGFFPDPTLADALLDRIVHRSHEIHIKGESMRKLMAKTEKR